MFYVMFTSIVLKIFLDCVLFYHAFQVKTTQIYLDVFVFLVLVAVRLGYAAGVSNTRPAITYCAARDASRIFT